VAFATSTSVRRDASARQWRRIARPSGIQFAPFLAGKTVDRIGRREIDAFIAHMNRTGRARTVTLDERMGTIALPNRIDFAPEPLYEEAYQHRVSGPRISA
jgi:hypothetical protein